MSPEQRHWLAVHIEPLLLGFGIFLVTLIILARVEGRQRK